MFNLNRTLLLTVCFLSTIQTVQALEPLLRQRQDADACRWQCHNAHQERLRVIEKQWAQEQYETNQRYQQEGKYRTELQRQYHRDYDELYRAYRNACKLVTDRRNREAQLKRLELEYRAKKQDMDRRYQGLRTASKERQQALYDRLKVEGKKRAAARKESSRELGRCQGACGPS